MTHAEAAATAQEPDSESCLCVVVSHAKAASLVAAVTAQAAARLMMSPALGDFVELSFADLGPPDELALAPRRIADALTRPRGDARGRYFALVVVDRSAAAVEQVLADCGASALFAALPVHLRGIASREDRLDDEKRADIVLAPTGSWSGGELIEELRSYADELLRHFAVSPQPGLSQDEVDKLRGSGQAQPLAEDEPAGTRPEQPATPDILDSRPRSSGETSVPADAGISGTTSASDHSEASAPRSGPAQLVEPVPQPRPRWLRAWPRLRGPRPEEVDVEAAEPTPVRASGLVYLLVTGETIADDRSSWHRGRSVLAEIDAKIAAVPGVRYHVRALGGGEQTLVGDLRQAGQLTRRDIRCPVDDADFAAVIEEIRRMLRRDHAVIEATGLPAVRPGVVLYAPDPPLADPAAVRAFRDLCQEAMVAWVVPRAATELLAPDFTDAPGAHLVLDQATAADDVVASVQIQAVSRG